MQFRSSAAPARPKWQFIMTTFIGSFLCISCLEWLTLMQHQLWIMAPFGATCVLAFALPESPLAQPRHIIGGHFITAFIALMVLQFFGNGLWQIAFAVATGIIAMQILRVTHPPAGANPLVILMTNTPWSFLIQPVLAGSICIVLIAWISHCFISKRTYPVYWW
nr:HPP family protein [Acinetobacter qingfengensis]